MIGIIIGQQSGSGGGGGGSTILTGQGSPSSAIGNNGDFYIDKNSPSIYGPKANGLWPSPIGLGGTGFVTRGGSSDPFIVTQAGEQHITLPVDNPVNVELLINGLLQPENLFSMNGNIATVLAAADVRPNDAIEFEFETITASSGVGNSNIIDERPSGAIDGVNTLFKLSQIPMNATLGIYINGLRQDSEDYSLVGDTVTFNLPPSTGAKLRATYNWQ